MSDRGTTEPPVGVADPAGRDQALVAEATRKSGLVWVTVPGGRPRPVWHIWHEGAAYVLTGGREQELPGMAAAATGGRPVSVTVASKDTGGRLVTWPAAVAAVAPGSADWAAVVPLLQAKRLNPPDGDEAPARWARESVLHRLAPAGELLESPDRLSTSSHAAEPADTPATTRVRVPFTLHRRPRRKRL